MAIFYGYNPPFIGGVQNVLSRQEDLRLIKNDILQLLLTVPGERVMRPDFGVNLRDFVFEQMDNADLISLAGQVKQQVQRQEPRVTVQNVVIEQEPDSNRIKLTLIAQLRKDPSKDVTVELFLRNGTAIPRGKL